MHGLQMASKTKMTIKRKKQQDSTSNATSNNATAPQHSKKAYGTDLQEMLDKQ